MESIITEIIQSILSSFDFAFCLIVNLATYFVVQGLTACKLKLGTWAKRCILVLIILLTGVLYKVTNADDIRVLINSAILAPVSWSWIFKPILHWLGLDYKKEDKEEEYKDEEDGKE